MNEEERTKMAVIINEAKEKMHCNWGPKRINFIGSK